MWNTHRITIEAERYIPALQKKEALIRKTVKTVLKEEGVMAPCEVNVLLTDDEGIAEINKEQRGVNTATDVLSFPMLELAAGEPISDRRWADPGSGLTMLGDVVLSYDRLLEQARDYGHSRERELCYLIAHSILHLLGYDHLDEGDEKRTMRQREERVLRLLGMSWEA